MSSRSCLLLAGSLPGLEPVLGDLGGHEARVSAALPGLQAKLDLMVSRWGQRKDGGLEAEGHLGDSRVRRELLKGCVLLDLGPCPGSTTHKGPPWSSTRQP